MELESEHTSTLHPGCRARLLLSLHCPLPLPPNAFPPLFPVISPAPYFSLPLNMGFSKLQISAVSSHPDPGIVTASLCVGEQERGRAGERGMGRKTS